MKFKKIFILVIFILLTGCAYNYQKSGYRAELTETEKRQLLYEHNKWRKYVGVAPLRWNYYLEKMAQEWADKLSSQYGCRMIHSKTNYGENIYWANYASTPTEVVNKWASERFYYDYSTNSCKAGKTCGHYTQIIWQDTTEIGCGRAICKNMEEIWVCNYNPAGNIKNKKPY